LLVGFREAPSLAVRAAVHRSAGARE
jgi:hypothetical protein